MIRPNSWSPEHDALLRQYAPTLRASDLSPLLGGRSAWTIRAYARRHGIPLEFSCKRTHLQNARVHSVDHGYFGTIDTAEKAYWLGAILADGTVHEQRGRNGGVTHRMSLSQHASDREWLERFRADIEASYPLKLSSGTTLALAVSSRQMCDDLRRHGVTPRKTFGHPAPTVRGPLLPHFVRGFFDGDGCIYTSVRKVSQDPVVLFSATLGMCEWLLREIRQGASISTGGVYRVSSPVIRAARFPGRRAVEAIYRWMYHDATRWMPRKRTVFESIYGVVQ